MKRFRLMRLLAGLPALFLASCEGEVPTTMVHFKQANLLESLLTYASNGGPVYTVIHGTPFPGREAETAAAVTGTFGNTVTWRKSSFTTRKEEAPHPEIRVVVAFNAAEATNARALCRGDQPQPASGDKLRVRAVFCTGADLVSDVSGFVKPPSAPDDVMFGKLISQVARELLDPNLKPT